MKQETALRRLFNLVTGTDLSYNEEGKAKFHRLARTVLKDVAAEMDLAPGSYEIRSNKAGIAVSGEVTLHGEHIYIQLDQGIDFGDGKQFIFRHCQHRKDYTGGFNRWMTYKELLDFPAAVEQFKKANENCI